MSRPESVSSRMARRGSRTAICRISLRFFSPPEKPSLTPRYSSCVVHLQQGQLVLHGFQEVEGIQLRFSPRARRLALRAARRNCALATPGISMGYWKARNRPARARSSGPGRAGPGPGSAPALGDLVALAARQHLGQGALAGAVRPHDGVDLAGLHGEVDALAGSALPSTDTCRSLISSMAILLHFRFSRPRPSRLTASSFWASTANSMGSSLNTSLQKPLTIRLTASSSDRPRLAAGRTTGPRRSAGGGLVLHPWPGS
jgi:hypothetical protein